MHRTAIKNFSLFLGFFLFPSFLLGNIETKNMDEVRFKQAVIQAVDDYYYKQLDIQQLKKMSLSEIVKILDEDSSLIEPQTKESDYVRGFKKRKGIRDVKMLEHNIACVSISYFSTGIAKEFKRVVKSMQSNGRERLILDLRECPGGDFKEALSVAEMFVSHKQILAIIERRNSKIAYRSKNADPLTIPLVVLVNEQTASSAELVSAILKRNKNTTVLGTPTQGKATIQQIIPIDHSWLCLSTGHWRLAQDESQSPCPVIPHHIVNGSSQQLDAAISVLSNTYK